MRIAAAAVLAMGLLIGFAGGAAAQEPGDLEERIFRAFYEENGLRDFPKAATLYAEAAEAARAAKDEKALLRALLGSGRCLMKTGRVEEAKAAFRAALEVDPACHEAAEAIASADREPDGIEDELRTRIRELVWKLAGPERDQAAADLRRIGGRSVPLLEEGLRTADVGIVTGAAAILANLPAPGARGALARALADPKVAFPDVVRQAVGDIPMTGNDADRNGRYALLRAAAVLEGPTRHQVLNELFGRQFSAEPAEEVVPVLRDILRGADDELKLVLLSAPFGPSATALVPTAVEFLRSGDGRHRQVALWCLNTLKELPAEAVEALRTVMESGTAREQASAFLMLDSGKALGGEERDRAVNRLLDAEDTGAVERTVAWLREGNGGDSRPGVSVRWHAGLLGGFLKGLRRGLDGAGEDAGRLAGALYTVLGTAVFDLPPDDLADLLGRCERPRKPGEAKIGSVSHVAQLLKAEVGRRVQVSFADPVESGRLFMAGLSRLQGPALQAWIQPWFSSSNAWTRLPEEVQIALAMHPEPEVRAQGYNCIVQKVKEGRLALPPGVIARIAEDLPASAGGTNGPVWALARSSHDPSLAPVLRGMIEQHTIPGVVASCLSLLQSCVGNEAIPDFRNALERFGYANAWMLDMLVELAGKESVGDIRAWLAKNPQGTPNQPVNYLELLVNLAGKEAAPDLRACLAREYNEQVLQVLVGLLGREALPDLRAAFPGTRSPWIRRRLVEFLGVEAVPDLVAAVVANPGMGDPRWAICGVVRNPPGPGHLDVPPEVAVGFFEALPEERRTGSLLEQVSFVLPAEKRNAYVNGYLADARAPMVAAAARVVRRFNLVEFWPRLLPLLDHPDEDVRAEAKEALDSIRNYRELKDTFERYGMEGAKKALDDATALAKDPDPVKRRGAALALGALGDASGVPLLLSLLDDKDPAVRASALSALERLGGM